MTTAYTAGGDSAVSLGTADERTPDHYRGAGRLQPFDVIDAFGLDFFSGNVCKYLLRYQTTHNIEDLKKAAHYLDEYRKRQVATFPTS
jgi:hypothetical protein